MGRPVPRHPPGGRLRRRRPLARDLPEVVGGDPFGLPPRPLLQRLLGGVPTRHPAEQHTAAGKESGLTAHVERWNNTLRQRLGRFVRKSLSFSKSDTMHELCLRLFLHDYNKSLALSCG